MCLARAAHNDSEIARHERAAGDYRDLLGVSFGRRITDIDPEAWRIVDGKLYLNYAPDPQGDPEELVARADANWKKHKQYFTGE